jgi:glucan phosphoethanolaminetransferase (alkaline phosphatase superfamily)
MSDIKTLLQEPFFWLISAGISILLSITANLLTIFVRKVHARQKLARKKEAAVIQEQLKQQNMKTLTTVVYLHAHENVRVSVKLDAIWLLLRAGTLFTSMLLLILALPLVKEHLNWVLYIFLLFLCSTGLVVANDWIWSSKRKMNLARMADERERYSEDYVSPLTKLERSNFDLRLEAGLARWDEDHFGVTAAEMRKKLSKKPQSPDISSSAS